MMTMGTRKNNNIISFFFAFNEGIKLEKKQVKRSYLVN